MATNWTHIQGALSAHGAFGTSQTVTLGAAPTLGNIVVVAAIVDSTSPGPITVKDSNNNAYTLTPSSPFIVAVGFCCVIAVLYSAPANATAAITMSWTPSTQTSLWADEFAVNFGLASFDSDAAIVAGTAGTVINQPALTPSTVNELLYAVTAPFNGVVTAPAAGVTQGAWVGVGGGIDPAGNSAEYALNVSSVTPLNFTDSFSSDTVGSLAVAIKSSASGQASTIFMLAR